MRPFLAHLGHVRDRANEPPGAAWDSAMSVARSGHCRRCSGPARVSRAARTPPRRRGQNPLRVALRFARRAGRGAGQGFPHVWLRTSVRKPPSRTGGSIGLRAEPSRGTEASSIAAGAAVEPAMDRGRQGCRGGRLGARTGCSRPIRCPPVSDVNTPAMPENIWFSGT